MKDMRAAVIDGKLIGAGIRARVAAEAGELAAAGWEPRLVSVSVGDTAAADLYVRNQQRSAESAGVDLTDQVIGDRAFQKRDQPFEGSRMPQREFARRRIIPAAAALDHIGRKRPRRAGKADQRRFSRQSRLGLS